MRFEAKLGFCSAASLAVDCLRSCRGMPSVCDCLRELQNDLDQRQRANRNTVGLYAQLSPSKHAYEPPHGPAFRGILEMASQMAADTFRSQDPCAVAPCAALIRRVRRHPQIKARTHRFLVQAPCCCTILSSVAAWLLLAWQLVFAHCAVPT